MAKLAAEVKLALRLSRLLRIDEAVQIDQGFVSYAEFQLFLSQSTQPAQGIPPQSPAWPVTGITLDAALEFCAWLVAWERVSLASQVEAGTEPYFYRLPTQAEIDRIPATEHSAMLCWTIGSSLRNRGLRLVKQRLEPEYHLLYRHLIAMDWEKADQATTDILLKTAKPESPGVLDAKAIDTLPSSCLQMLDQLWVHCSGGGQGWGMQASLWKLTKGDLGKRKKQFWKRVGLANYFYK